MRFMFLDLVNAKKVTWHRHAGHVGLTFEVTRLIGGDGVLAMGVV